MGEGAAGQEDEEWVYDAGAPAAGVAGVLVLNVRVCVYVCVCWSTALLSVEGGGRPSRASRRRLASAKESRRLLPLRRDEEEADKEDELLNSGIALLEVMGNLFLLLCMPLL